MGIYPINLGLTIWLVLGCYFNAPPAVAQELNWKQLLSDAAQLSARGDLEGAAHAYAHYLAHDTHDTGTRLKFARLLVRQQRYHAAVQQLHAAKLDGCCSKEWQLTMVELLMLEHHFRRAKRALYHYMSKFGPSAQMYQAAGNLYQTRQKPRKALRAWCDGIDLDPLYIPNLSAAANVLLREPDNFSGLLLAEMYLNLLDENDTSSAIWKTRILKGYCSFLASDALPEPQALIQQPALLGNVAFADSLFRTFYPLAGDGCTADNLIMMRVRLLLSLPSSTRSSESALFAFHEEMIANGWFDVYNQWLFGQAEDPRQYQAFLTFHPAIIDSFRVWRRAHPLKLRSFSTSNVKKRMPTK